MPYIQQRSRRLLTLPLFLLSVIETTRVVWRWQEDFEFAYLEHDPSQVDDHNQVKTHRNKGSFQC